MSRDEAIAELIRIIRQYLDRMPPFYGRVIEAAIKRVEEAER